MEKRSIVNNLNGFEIKDTKILVIGIGGAGVNAIDNMISKEISGVDYLAVNTDAQHLAASKCENKLLIGEKELKGRGAGSKAKIGAAAAEESKEAIKEVIKDYDLIFLSAGMGGGTGTGAIPVIAGIAKELGILTISVVTKPFFYENRSEVAEEGISKLIEKTDGLVVIKNDKIASIIPEDMDLEEVFKIVDEVLQKAVHGIVGIINFKGKVNIDFQDLITVLKEKGLAHIGIGAVKCNSEGEKKKTPCLEAVKSAIDSPLLDTKIDEAESVIVHIVGKVRFQDYLNSMSYIQSLVGEKAVFIGGWVESGEIVAEDMVLVTLLATGVKEDDKKGKLSFEASKSVSEIQKNSTIEENKEIKNKDTNSYTEDKNLKFANLTNNFNNVSGVNPVNTMGSIRGGSSSYQQSFKQTRSNLENYNRPDVRSYNTDENYYTTQSNAYNQYNQANQYIESEYDNSQNLEPIVREKSIMVDNSVDMEDTSRKGFFNFFTKR